MISKGNVCIVETTYDPDYNKAIIFRYLYNKKSKKHDFEEIRGIVQYKSFIPDYDNTVRFMLSDMPEGVIKREKVWYYLKGKSEEDLAKLRLNFIKTLISDKKEYMFKMINNITKVSTDIRILEEVEKEIRMSNSN